MKKLLLLSIAIASTSYCAAQFTAEDFPREATHVDSFIVGTSVFALPEHGAGLIWDYSSIDTDYTVTRVYHDATSDPAFENAFHYRQRDLEFQGFYIESTEYESLDENSYSAIGRSITDVAYPIASITGGADDELRFVGGNFPYEGNYNYLTFPFDYQSSWDMEYTQVIDFELTVAGFGLADVPGNRTSFISHLREVVGAGSFIIPDENGNPSGPIQGLLFHATETKIDSVYLGGEVAPAALMGAFGLTQGEVTVEEYYVAYAYGFGAPLLSFDVIDGLLIDPVYRPSAAVLGSSVSVAENEQNTIVSYPNPATAGQTLNIRADIGQHISAVQFYSVSGQLVHEVAINTSNVAAGLAVTLPGSLSKGTYFVRLLTPQGEIAERSKIMIE